LKFLVSDNLKIDQDTVEDIKTSMDHLGAIFLWVWDAARSGSLQRIAEQQERADQAERERGRWLGKRRKRQRWHWCKSRSFTRS